VTDRQNLPSSFRDRDGRLFIESGVLYRRIYPSYEPHYLQLISSGLYKKLVDDRSLVPHDECPVPPDAAGEISRILRPFRLPVISYPYEWCFDQLKDAALLTLTIQKTALDHGMILKDASAYNVQFFEGRPIFIDTLSFETYTEGQSWAAYRQFCRHFLAPLALMRYRGSEHGRLLRADLDGMSLGLVSAALPWSSRLNLHLLLHLHSHARAERSAHTAPANSKPAASASLSRQALLAMLDSLESAVKGLHLKKSRKVWTRYYGQTHNYADAGLAEKESAVRDLLGKISYSKVWDIGANTGRFSRVCAERSALLLSLDSDPECVNELYAALKADPDARLYPLVYDAADPSPALGWALEERDPLEKRFQPDLILALALVHHLLIGRNLTWEQMAGHWSRLAKHFIIEYVPKTDSQIALLLSSRKDVFDDYNEQSFLTAFAAHYHMVAAKPISQNGRTLYLMTSRHA
jgi:ribosomal protein L11 methylase PrmA